MEIKEDRQMRKWPQEGELWEREMYVYNAVPGCKGEAWGWQLEICDFCAGLTNCAIFK